MYRDLNFLDMIQRASMDPRNFLKQRRNLFSSSSSFSPFEDGVDVPNIGFLLGAYGIGIISCPEKHSTHPRFNDKYTNISTIPRPKVEPHKSLLLDHPDGIFYIGRK